MVTPVLIAGLVFLACLAWLAASKVTIPLNNPGSATVLLEPAFTYEDVKRIAAGTTLETQPSLADALFQHAERLKPASDLPGDIVIGAAFVPAQAGRQRITHFGWPGAWFSKWEHSRYKDAVMRSGFRPQETNARLSSPRRTPDELWETGEVRPRKKWNWHDDLSIGYQPPVEDTGGVEVTTNIGIFAIVSSLGVIILAWGAASIAIWFVNILPGRQHRGGGRWFGWLAAAAMFAFIAFMAMRSIDRREYVMESGISRQNRDQTGIRTSALNDIVCSSTSDQQIARAILESVQEPASSQHYLGIALIPEARRERGTLTNYGRSMFVPVFTCTRTQFVRRPDLGSPDLMTFPAGTKLSVDFGSIRWRPPVIRWRQSAGDPNFSVETWSINADLLGALLVGAWLTWLLSRALCWTAAALVARKRRRHRRCIGCGYILRPG